MNILEELEKKFNKKQSSYMMVTILAMLDLSLSSGTVKLDKAVHFFKKFYESRLQFGKKSEKEGQRMAFISSMNDSQIKRLMLSMPLTYLNDLVIYDAEKEEFRFSEDVKRELEDENTREEVRNLAHEHLYYYYKDFDPNSLKLEELNELPLGVAVTATDVALLSGQNQIKGIHPIIKDGFKAVIVLCTIGGEYYSNEWIGEDKKKLKYYLEGKADRQTGQRSYNLDLPSNKAIINSRDEGYPIHVFTRRKKRELFHYAGIYVFDQLGEDDNGDRYFILKRKEIVSIKLPQVSRDLKNEEINYRDTVRNIYEYIKARGFVFEEDLLYNFFLSLKTKPFVILAGISGTGKTKLIELFAEALGATSDNGRFELIPVKPDWNDNSELLGYKNLEGKFQPGVLTRVIQRAVSDMNNPYFVCLDEMNLSRVEYYLSDFLSLIETRRWYGEELRSNKIFRETDFVFQEDQEEFAGLYIPENLYIVGTVNMDETTHPFSKKVLDRVNIIELVEVALDNYGVFNMEDNVDGQALLPHNVPASFLRNEYCVLNDCLPQKKAIVDEVVAILKNVNDILQPVNLHVGYRVRDEICFYMIYNREFGLIEKDKAFDWQLLQKVLPRIQGSSRKIYEVLINLFELCTNFSLESNEGATEEARNILENLAVIRWPRSARKIAYMLGRYEEDGFTSFWA